MATRQVCGMQEGLAVAYLVTGGCVGAVAVPLLALYLLSRTDMGTTRKVPLLFFLLPLVGWAMSLFHTGMTTGRTNCHHRPAPFMNPSETVAVVLGSYLAWVLVPLRQVAVNVGLLRVTLCLYGCPTYTHGRLCLRPVSGALSLGLGWMLVALVAMLVPFGPGFIAQCVVGVKVARATSVAEKMQWREAGHQLSFYMIFLQLFYHLMAITFTFFLWADRQRLAKFDLDHSKYQGIYLGFFTIYMIFFYVQTFDFEKKFERRLAEGETRAAIMTEWLVIGWVGYGVTLVEVLSLLLLWGKTYQTARRTTNSHSDRPRKSDDMSMAEERPGKEMGASRVLMNVKPSGRETPASHMI